MIQVFKQMIKAMENTTRLDFGSDSYRQFNAAIQAGKQAIAELENSLILTSEVNISNNFKQPQRTEQNFCSRCGKRTNDIHTCTPPQD